MSTSTRGSVIRAIARITRIDLAVAARSKRHNPILDSEIPIEEELINLKESLDSYYTAGDTLQKYPQVYSHIIREKRAITKHCIGLVVRMIHGRNLPRPYGKADIDFALKRLVQMVVFEAQKAGKRIDDDVMELFRPYLSMRQRVAMRDFSMDMIKQVSQYHRAQDIVGKLPIPYLRSR